jgi:hypothetical protein
VVGNIDGTHFPMLLYDPKDFTINLYPVPYSGHQSTQLDIVECTIGQQEKALAGTFDVPCYKSHLGLEETVITRGTVYRFLQV